MKFKIERRLTAEEAAAFRIVKKLQEAGFETYIAGGAVRDLYLKKEAHDIDIATAAKPGDIKKIFHESYDRGKAFGVKAIKINDFEFEVATFRVDIGTADHRRPTRVEFTSAENDAKRRDFTINALFYDPTKLEIIDFVGGLEDLKNKIIRFVGLAKWRIDEDYLRMLRAVRFTHRLGFALDFEAARAIKKEAKNINQISAERIREELSAIICGPHPAHALMQMESLGLLKEILPELIQLRGVKQPPEFHSEGDVWIHTLMAMEKLKNPSASVPSAPKEPPLGAELAWTVLLHDIAKPQTQGFRDHPKSKITFFEHDEESAKMARQILNRLKFSREFIDACAWAISQHMRIIHAFRGMSERKQKRLFTYPHIQLLLDLTRVDLASSLRPDLKADLSMYKRAVKKKEKFEKEATDEEKQQVKKFTLITGKDIMEILKIPAGPKVGEIKTKIEASFLDDKISTRDEALKMIKEFHSDES